MQKILPFIEAFIGVLIVFFSPVAGMILIVAICTLLDTGFGVWRAYNKNEKVCSKTFRFGFVPKLFSYVGAVMLVYTSDFFIINDLTQVVVSVDFLSTKLIALTLISIEIRSMDESFKAVRGWSFIEKITGLLFKIKNIKKELDEIK